MANRYETAAELVARLLRSGKTEAEILAEHSDDAIKAALRDARSAERNGVRGTRAVDSAPVTRPFTLSPEAPRAPQATPTPRPRAEAPAATENRTVFSTTVPDMPEVQGGLFSARRNAGERPAVPRADNDDGIDETALKAVAGDPPKLADAVAAEREISTTAAKPVSSADAPRMSGDQGGGSGGPSGTGSGSGAGGPGGGGSSGGTPPGGGNPPPPGGPTPNGQVPMTPEAIDRQNQWNVQGMVLARLGAIDADFIKLRRGIPLSQEDLLKLENNINVGGLFDKDAPRVSSLEELIERVNIPEQKAVKMSGLTNFYSPQLANKVHPDDFTKFVRREGADAENTLPAIPGVSGVLSNAGSGVKGQNITREEVQRLRTTLTETGRINDLLDPKQFKHIKTPGQLDQYLRESPRNAVPGSVFDKVVGETVRGRELIQVPIPGAGGKTLDVSRQTVKNSMWVLGAPLAFYLGAVNVPGGDPNDGGLLYGPGMRWLGQREILGENVNERFYIEGQKLTQEAIKGRTQSRAETTAQEAAQSAADYEKSEAESALAAPMSSDSASLSGNSGPPSASASFKSAAEFSTAIAQNNDALIGLTATQVPKVSAAWAKVVADGDASPQERAGFEQELKNIGLQPSQVTLVAELGFSPP